jgi:chromosome segregation ATPase
MARPGISYQDVANAANEVRGKNLNPTMENVRAVLGTGSLSTINMHLRKWKSAEAHTQNVASKENLPPELVSLVKGLWQSIMGTAEQRIQDSALLFQDTIQILTQERDKFQSNNQRWQTLYNQWLQEKTRLLNEKEELEQGLKFTKNELQTLTTKHSALEEQLSEKQERVTELHRLHLQLQENLEHYREAAREQRLLDQAQFDKQKQNLECQLKDRNEQLLVLTEKTTITSHRYADLTTAYEQLQAEHHTLKQQNQELNDKMLNLETSLKESKQLYLKATDENSKLNILNQTYLETITEVKTQINTQTERLKHQKEAFAELQNQHTLLSQDKWMLAQEKSQLEGQLKQLEKMLVLQTA